MAIILWSGLADKTMIRNVCCLKATLKTFAAEDNKLSSFVWPRTLKPQNRWKYSRVYDNLSDLLTWTKILNVSIFLTFLLDQDHGRNEPQQKRRRIHSGNDGDIAVGQWERLFQRMRQEGDDYERNSECEAIQAEIGQHETETSLKNWAKK